jgi:hypothetical protein
LKVNEECDDFFKLKYFGARELSVSFSDEFALSGKVNFDDIILIEIGID